MVVTLFIVVPGDPAGLSRTTTTEEGVNNYTILILILNAPQLRTRKKLLSKQPSQITRLEFVNNIFDGYLSDSLYECMEHNGLEYSDIRIPCINAWEPVETTRWKPNNEYAEWAVVEWDGQFYALLSTEDIDLTVNPHESDNWGLIGDYVTDYAYELKETEYVVFDGRVWYPTMSPVADTLKEGYNFRYHDPRNPNIKKHMIKIALYELHKLISPNNVSMARITTLKPQCSGFTMLTAVKQS